MKKRLPLMFVLAAAMCVGIALPALAAAQEGGHEPENVLPDAAADGSITRAQIEELIEDNIRAGDPAAVDGFDNFTQEDYDSNFTDYADVDSTLILPESPSSDSGIANVIGTVFSKETNAPVAGAVVTVGSVNGGDTVSVATDSNGRFQVLGLTNGFYNWTLSQDGYYDAEYIGYGVCEGITTMLTFYISDQTPLSSTSYQYEQYGQYQP